MAAPSGVTVQNTFPCRLFWESDTSLFIGWADKFRQIDLIKRATSGSMGERDSTAKISNEWSTDCIIAGVSSFDANHVAILDEKLGMAKCSGDEVWQLGEPGKLAMYVDPITKRFY